MRLLNQTDEPSISTSTRTFISLDNGDEIQIPVCWLSHLLTSVEYPFLTVFVCLHSRSHILPTKCDFYLKTECSRNRMESLTAHRCSAIGSARVLSHPLKAPFSTKTFRSIHRPRSRRNQQPTSAHTSLHLPTRSLRGSSGYSRRNLQPRMVVFAMRTQRLVFLRSNLTPHS